MTRTKNRVSAFSISAGYSMPSAAGPCVISYAVSRAIIQSNEELENSCDLTIVLSDQSVYNDFIYCL